MRSLKQASGLYTPLERFIRRIAWLGWGILMCCLVASRCHASQVSVGNQASEAYASEQAAAVAAIAACIDRSVVFEYAGGIYAYRGGFYYTTPFSDGNPSDVGTFKLRIPREARLVALYHTHPSSVLPGDNSEEISDADIHAANNMGVRSYVGILKTHKIVLYIPHKSAIFHKQDSSMRDILASYGMPIGAI